MTDTSYRIRVVPKTMGCVWKLVDPDGKAVAYGMTPEDALKNASVHDSFCMFVDSIFGGMRSGYLSRA